MYTLHNITDAISLAYKAEKQLPTLPHPYPQRTQWTYTPEFSSETKQEPHSSMSNSNPHTSKDQNKTNTNQQQKPAFVPLRNSYRKPKKIKPTIPMPNLFQSDAIGEVYQVNRSNECTQRPRAVGLLEEFHNTIPYDDSQQDQWYENEVVEELVMPDEGDQVQYMFPNELVMPFLILLALMILLSFYRNYY